MALSTQLFEEIRSDFFRVLSFESAALYLDSTDAIASSMPARGGGIARQEALEIVGDILRINPGMIVEGQTADNSTVAAKSNLVLNKLIASGWLEEPERSDYQRQVFLDPNSAHRVQRSGRSCRCRIILLGGSSCMHNQS